MASLRQRAVSRSWQSESLCQNQTSNLSKTQETRDSLRPQVVLVYLQKCRRNSLLICVSQPKIAQKH